MTISFARHQFPPSIIRHAVWLYVRFTLSYRDVEDLLAERGLDVSYETVRRWVLMTKGLQIGLCSVVLNQRLGPRAHSILFVSPHRSRARFAPHVVEAALRPSAACAAARRAIGMRNGEHET
jgi:hypothetical protein